MENNTSGYSSFMALINKRRLENIDHEIVFISPISESPINVLTRYTALYYKMYSSDREMKQLKLNSMEKEILELESYITNLDWDGDFVTCNRRILLAKINAIKNLSEGVKILSKPDVMPSLPLQKVFTAEEIREKLLQLNPQIKDNKYMNPFLYDDIGKWYQELGQ